MLTVDKEKCCGCKACLQSCPKGAITCECDEFGFETIRVNDDKCINCGRCKMVCPMLNNKKHSTCFKCGSAFAIDENDKRNGSSGGLFGTFAKEIINRGGVVYGAKFDENLKLKTTKASDFNDLQGLYKSKYLLCDTTGSFKNIKQDLEQGKQVLYCSSPCQIAGLLNYLNKEYDNLLCVEFVCHGVGNQKQFDASIEFEEKEKNIKITNFSFREKWKKASLHYYSYCFIDNKTNKTKLKKGLYLSFPYYFAYCDRLNCRESCYSCPFADKNRVADITIGDFHTIKKYQPKIDRFAGISMFLCNTEKGSAFLESINHKLVITEYDLDVIYQNNRFGGTEKVPSRRRAYLNDFAQKEYKDVVKKYFSYRRDWRYYYYKMPGFIRALGNRFLGK